MSQSQTNNTENVAPIVTQPTASPPPPHRKVSIANDPVSDNHYDNLAFEHSAKQQKNSQHNDHHHPPSRKRSILVNGGGGGNNHGDGESIYSHHSYDFRQHKQPEAVSSGNPAQIEQSWIYNFCIKCRGMDNTPSWEPPMWQRFCPYPLCPSYRQFARFWSIVIIGVIAWITLYVIIGKQVAPGGSLFGLVVLIVAANVGGFLMSLTTLPRLIGMLLTGILMQNLGFVDLNDDTIPVTIQIRKCALVLILIRAGLEMDPAAFKRVWLTILKLGLVPWTIEFVLCAILGHYFFSLPWLWSFALGAIIAAVSPAVIVPCLFRLRTKGYGVNKGIPTLIVAISGIDDAASVAIFGILASIIFGEGGLSYQISQAPVCVIGGLLYGVLWGVMAKFLPEQKDAYVIPIRTLMLFAGGLLAVYGSEKLGYEGAGPLGVVFAAFVSNYFWCKGGWEIEDNPVGTAFEIFWMFFEPALFGITGAAIKINDLDRNIVTVGLSILAVTGIVRIISTALIAFGDNLNLKEKIFVSLACMAKATVQAALGPVCLRRLPQERRKGIEGEYAHTILMVSILSIILTAPIGAILISLTGPRLLTTTKPITQVEGWRRSHRPSLYDISIIDEQEEREDPEMQKDDLTQENTNSNANIPVFTVTK